MTQKKPKKGGPRWYPDYDKVEVAASLFPTDSEMAVLLECSRETIKRLKADTDDYNDAVSRGQDKRRIKLRRLQWKTAEEGNPTMMIFLGKQHLGQADKQEVTGKDGEALQQQTVIILPAKNATD